MKADKTKPMSKYRSILIFGPPGSGKGTMSRYLSSVANLCHLSSGDIFRGLSPDSPGGQLFQSYAHKGLLVPDEVTIEIWHQYVEGLVATNRYFPGQQYLLLDGIPRTLKQAEILDQYLDVERIIFLDIEKKEELFARLQRRGKIEGRKDDMDINVLRKRMEVFEKETAAVLSHYPSKVVLKFNADQRPLEVLRDILVELSEVLAAMPKAQAPS